jgi:adenosylcobinamide-phosphate synthase
MSFFAVLFALLIEQVKPLPRDNAVHDALVSWIAWTGRQFDAGKPWHAWVVWAVGVLAPALLTCVLWLAVRQTTLIGALVLNVVLLYLTLGFRQFSHHYTGIRDALQRGEEDEARRLLAAWRHVDAADLPRTELLRQVIEHSLLEAHRHVFGVFFWFVVLAAFGLGPLGAVLYRMAEFASRFWDGQERAPDAPVSDSLLAAARTAFQRLDHVPARLTAFGFAVVGNFEEAVAGWRRDAGLWPQANEGIILAAAAGALGLQLGTPVSTLGALPLVGHLQAVVGLVWRSVVLWMLLLALLTLANLVG